MTSTNNSGEFAPELIWGEGQGSQTKRWSLVGSQLIGREHADITIPLAEVSRRHAIISVKTGLWTLEDLGSRNGTSVNGTMLSAGIAHPLRDGDVILVAGMAELLYKDPMATPVAPRLGKLRGLWIDEQSMDVWIDAQKVTPALSTKQYKLLLLIYQANGKPVSRMEIVAAVWAYASAEGISDDAIDSLIKRLRRKLAAYTSTALIEPVRDKGIRLVTESD